MNTAAMIDTLQYMGIKPLTKYTDDKLLCMGHSIRFEKVFLFLGHQRRYSFIHPIMFVGVAGTAQSLLRGKGR